jgi:YbbR domain-containing protein
VVSFFTDHLGVKLLALLLAIVVYAHVYTDQEQEAILRVPLRITGLPADLVLTEDPPPEVELAARGSGKQVLKLRVQHPVLIVNLNEARPGQVQRMLSPVDVALPVGSQVVVTEIRAPRLVELMVDTLITREVSVRVVPEGRPPEGYVLGEDPRPDPPRVTVRGPSHVVRDLDHVAAGPLLLTDLVEGFQTLELAVHHENERVTVDPPVVSVEAILEPLATRTFPSVPIRMDGLATVHAARVEPESAEVVLAGPRGALVDVGQGDLRLHLEVDDLPPGRYLLAPQLDTIDPLLELVSVRPARFLVEIGVLPGN